MSKSKRGRPPLAVENRQGSVITFRVTPAERRAICRAAKRLKIGVSQLVREVLLEFVNNVDL